MPAWRCRCGAQVSKRHARLEGLGGVMAAGFFDEQWKVDPRSSYISCHGPEGKLVPGVWASLQ